MNFVRKDIHIDLKNFVFYQFMSTIKKQQKWFLSILSFISSFYLGIKMN